MRTVDHHLLQEKIDEAVTHYINTHQPSESLHVDGNDLTLNVQDEAGNRVVTVMHSQFPSQLCSRQISMNEPIGDGPWNEELLDSDARLAALVAHLSRVSHHQNISHHKVPPIRSDVDSSGMLGGPLRLFNGQALDQQAESLVSDVSSLPPLPPLQEMKRCPDPHWFNTKTKATLKDDSAILSDGERCVLEAGSSPAQHKQSRKSLPHKKRISRRLRRSNGHTTEDLVVINCHDEVPQEEILPDNFVTSEQHQQHLAEEAHHITHEMRPILICQECGEFYGEEQLKFYHHLKHHYEPHNGTILIESPVTECAIDKMTNTCIVDNVATLPDSIVELSLESTLPKTSMYQPIDKHILYTTSDKTLNYSNNKVLYSVASMDKEPIAADDKSDLYCSLDKERARRKQKPSEAPVKDKNAKMEEMNEFSEPEDLMEGIHVSVEEGGEQYEPALPHLTVDNGHVTQEHSRHWYHHRDGSGHNCGSCLSCETDCAYCSVCLQRDTHAALPLPPTHLKEEVLQRIFESTIVSDSPNFTDNLVQETNELSSESVHHTDNPQQKSPQYADQEEYEHRSTYEIKNNIEYKNIMYSEKHEEEYAPKNTDYEQKNTVYAQKNTEYTQNKTEYGHKDVEYVSKNTEYERVKKNTEDNQHEYIEKNTEYTEKQIEYAENESKYLLKNAEDKKAEASLQEEVWEFKDDESPKKKSVRIITCPTCGREFKHRNSLLYHMLSHKGQRSFECSECQKSFLTAGSLRKHFRVHNNEKPYKCQECGRDFRQWGDLKYHLTSLHSDKKNFKCEFCGKDFARKYSLSVHRRIHTGERNYKCELCPKTFRAASYKSTHMRTHTGEKPHKCLECDKPFRAAGDMRRHMQTHEKSRARLHAKHKAKHDAAAEPSRESPDPAEPRPSPAEPRPSPADNTAPPNVVVTNGKPKHMAARTTKKTKSPNDKKNKLATKECVVPDITISCTQNVRAIDNNDFPSNVEVYDTKSGPLSKFKNLNANKIEGELVRLKDLSVVGEPKFATLKPMFKLNQPSESFESDKCFRTQNTDGKMTVFTHVDKGRESGSLFANPLHDVRSNLDVREGREINGENIENGFIERLTAIII